MGSSLMLSQHLSLIHICLAFCTGKQTFDILPVLPIRHCRQKRRDHIHLNPVSDRHGKQIHLSHNHHFDQESCINQQGTEGNLSLIHILKLGIIGLGNMGSGHCSNILAGLTPEIKLTAAADLRQSRRDWAKETLPDEDVYKRQPIAV